MRGKKLQSAKVKLRMGMILARVVVVVSSKVLWPCCLRQYQSPEVGVRVC